jgi:NADPH2:quinone reductase
MKLIVAGGPGGPEVLQLRAAEKPVPQEGQALIRVAAAALNPLDVLVRQGRVQWMAGKWPFTPGLEYGGIVESVGPGVDSGWIGRKAISFAEFGGCAEYALAPASRLLPLNPELGWHRGIAWRTPTLMAWHLLNDAARLQRGETILIHSAAGAVGAMATQIAKDLGARVIGLAGGPAKIAFAQGFGADALFDYRLSDWPAQVARFNGGQGVDVIIDGNGGPNAPRNYELIAPNGRVFHIGATSGMAAPQVAPQMLIAKSFSVGGFNLNAIPEETLAVVERTLAKKLVQRAWRFPVGQVAQLQDVPALHARFEAREVAGRAIIDIGGDL